MGDVVPLVAREIASESSLLCFDEFQITDIADAAILSRLIGGLWEEGVVTIATSNREPHDLYRGGLNWSTYIPAFVKLLREHCLVHCLDGGMDYRNLHSLEKENLELYICPLGTEASSMLATLFNELSGTPLGEASSETIEVMMGRSLHIPHSAGGVAFMDFQEHTRDLF